MRSKITTLTPPTTLTSTNSFLTHLECTRCGAIYDPDIIQTLCTATTNADTNTETANATSPPSCGGALFARYDLKAAAAALDPKKLHGVLLGSRPNSLWRYQELLPVRHIENIVTLGEGMTPLLALERLGREIGLPNLWIKDEGANPTGTFKARGAAVGISKAKELGIKSVAIPTNGNAGDAWACYGARAGIEVTLAMPIDAPATSVLESVAAGATVYRVNGLISDAGAIIHRSAPLHSWFESATLREPYRIEGKKTMGYEIAEQTTEGFSSSSGLPDAILYPTGGGIGIIAIYKAMQEMREMGWIAPDARLPRMVAVQAENCAPIVRAFLEGRDESEKWENPSSVATGVRVPKSLGDYLVLRAVRETDGTCIAVSDEDILDGMRQIGRLEGMFVCPEGAAVVAAARKLRQVGWLKEDMKVLLLNTGSGIKYPQILGNGVVESLPILEPGATIVPNSPQHQCLDASGFGQ